MSNLTDISDVIIIGSGPAGLSAAIYVVRAGLSVTVIEKEFMGTGQIADSSKVDNYLGIPAISGYDLGESFREHALSLGVTIEDNNVTRLTTVDDIWELELSDGSTKKYMRLAVAIKSYRQRMKNSIQAKEYHIVPYVTEHFIRIKMSQ